MNAIGRYFGFGRDVETRGGSVDSAGGESPLPAVMPPAREGFGVVSWREAMKVSAYCRSKDEITTMLTSMAANVREGRTGPLLDPAGYNFPSIVLRPNLDMDYEEFVEVSVSDLIDHGEYIWRKVGSAQVVNLIPISPEEMTIVRDRLPDGTWGRTRYAHMGKDIPRSQIIHKKHTAVTNEARGTGPLHHAQNDIRAALILAEFQRDWFKGGVPSSTLATDQHLSPAETKEIQARWNEWVSSHNGQTVILSAGVKLEPIHLKPAEAQMLEVQDAIDRKIVRTMGTPAFDLMVPGGTESRTYQNLEQSTLQFLTTTLARYMNAIERGLSEALLPGLRVELDETGLLRMDSKTKAEVDTANIANGTRTADELRARDGLKPLPKSETPAAPKKVASERVDQAKEIEA
ncbi:phage portal protein [Rhodococcoides fascians]|uniref:phage portal protein n=1 Tax=Rhodococcoides fascians TaxID=1828 RepID=UPI001DA02FE1|nr:phage portal protein [Rhodococcus fascians]CAH0318693.1 hypothetical protein SRABI91_05293 [Rhodococcus fascians]